MDIGTWERAIGGDTITCSSAVRTWYGLRGAGPWSSGDLLAMMHPDDRPAVNAAMAASLADPRVDCEFECRVRGSPNDRIIYTRGHVALAPDGRPERLLGVAIDVTKSRLEQPQHDGTIEEFFNNAPDTVVFTDLDGRIVDINSFGKNALGIIDMNAVRGTSWLELWPNEHREHAKRALTKASTGETTRFAGALTTYAGISRWWSVAITTYHDQRDDCMRLLIPMRDITQEKETEAQILAQALFARNLLGVVSHDLRNPLSAIKLSAESLLRHSTLNKRDTGKVARMGLAADRALRMVHDLLDMTQVQLAGGIVLRVAATNIDAVLANTVQELRDANPSRILHYISSGPVQLDVDPDRIAQLITNLVGNALQYSLSDTAVEVRLATSENSVMMSVHNEGRPIDAALLPLLFEPMQRGASDPGQRSVGLGLFIVKHIALAHRGTINVASAPNVGTTFTLTLPQR